MAVKRVTADTLNGEVEFDGPFQVIDATTIETSLPDLFAPSVLGFSDADGQISERPTIDGLDEYWEFVDGYSGQFGYSGPVMHPSEFLGGAMARDVLDRPGIYVVTVATDANGTDDDNAYGWVLLHRTV